MPFSTTLKKLPVLEHTSLPYRLKSFSSVGAKDGVCVGADVVGAVVGETVGAKDGGWVGAVVVGPVVGETVGDTDGTDVVGDVLGAAVVGLTDGESVGEAVGAAVAGIPSQLSNVPKSWVKITSFKSVANARHSDNVANAVGVGITIVQS